MADESFTNDSLTLYLSYDYLTAEQLAKVFLSVDQLYQNLAKALIFGQLNYAGSARMAVYPIPLCIQEVRTGNSIDVKFSFERRFFPSVGFENKEVKITLPEWSAVLIIAGAILSFGLDKYKTILEIGNDQLENQKLKIELQEQCKKIEELKVSRSNPQIYSIMMNLNEFHAQIYSGNINTIEVNGHSMYKKK